ncbi:hypothetical protein AB0V79_00330 [Mesorhizobium ciceri]|uniref:hypothetical protein n=1 Tax=Mesorhizobium TaxID=68287 RepID=UPI0007A94667|nr:hypothetical protein [Mesorhizobium ciceri]AMY01002.1 hypothetical protein A4R29_17025 [Mesorhizobium ciceri biovar biserrulae]
MGKEQIIYGNPEPWLGLTFKTLDQRFDVYESGKRFYSSEFLTDTKFGDAGLGIDILLNDWEAKLTGDPRSVFYYGDVRLRSLGDRTKNLVAEMSAKVSCEGSSANGAASEKLFVECVALNGDPANLEARPLVGKLFFGEPGDDNECQVFLALDTARECAWFGEKDPVYSRNVIGWLARLS